MEIYQQAEDLILICVRAVSCPPDTGGAFKKLIALLPSIEGRSFLGISYQEQQGEIVYKAAALKYLDEEAEHFGCEEFILKKGFYLAELVNNWKNKAGSIGAAFRRITDNTEDINFPLVEWYCDHDVLCMARICNSDIIEKIIKQDTYETITVNEATEH